MTALSNINSQPSGFNVIDYFLLPAIIIDKKLNIIYHNALWLEMFDGKPADNVNEILKAELVQKLDNFIKNSFFKKDFLVDNFITLPNSKDPLKSFSLLIYYYPVSSKDYFILSFKSNSSELGYGEAEKINKINILNDDDRINDYISIELRETFESISEIIPLSLVNKNKVKKLLDERSEIIWLKDSNDNIILANQSFFYITGINETEHQKNTEDYIFFPYQKDLLKNLNEYSKTINRPILISNIKYPLSSVQSYPLIIYPVKDKSGKNNYFFYILLKTFSENDNKAENLLGIQELPFPFLRLDNNNYILQSNKSFNDLLEMKKLFNSKSLDEIFEKEVVEKIEELIASPKEIKLIYLNEDFRVTTLENCDFIIRIIINKFDGYNLFFYPLSQLEDIKSILSQRGKMFDYYIKNSPEPIFIFDKESLKFLEINQSALNLYGYSKDEFLKLDLTDLYSPEDFQALMESLKHSNEQRTTPIFRQKTKLGKDVYVQLTYNDFKFNDRDSFFVVVKNVTKSFQLENENKLYKEIIENTSDIIMETDSLGFIKSVNQKALSKLGYDINSLLNTSFSSLVEDVQRGFVNSKLFNVKANSISELKIPIKRNDGKFVDSLIVSIPIKNPNDEVNSFKIIISLLENIKEVTTEVGEKIKEVIVEKPVYITESSVNQDYITSDFLSGVFHEILTPLNVIFGFTQEIIEGLEKPTPEQKEAADIISHNRTKLLDTMNLVVEYSELVTNSAQLNISEFALVEIIQKIENQAKEISTTFGIQFTLGKISSSLRVESDAEKLERVILGLIKIVCRLSQDKKIYLSSFALDQELFLISINDPYNTSTGYLTNLLNKIFNLQVEPRDVGAPRLTVSLTRFFMKLLNIRFVQSIKINDRFESGFLLPIRLSKSDILEPVPETVIEKTSIENKEFVISEIPDTSSPLDKKEIPLENKVELQKEKPPKPKIDLSGITCLYIEDQYDSQVLFKSQLKELKEIVIAPSFEEALSHLENRKFDFIVIDINLEGEYNGLDAMKLIRKISGYEKIPIFASTAYILPGNKERFIKAGFDGFVDKPIFKDKIIESLSNILSN